MHPHPRHVPHASRAEVVTPSAGSPLPSGPTAKGELTKSLVACGSTIVMSSWLVLHNKYVLQGVFPSSDCLLLVQNVFTLVLVLGARALGWLDFDATLDRGAIVSGLVYTLNVMCGMWSLSYLSVPIFSTVKRCTAAVSWVIELLVDRKPSTHRAAWPIAMMLAATVFAGRFDGQFVWYGYLFGAASCVLQGSAFELGRRVASSSTNRGIWSVLIANSAIALVVQSLFLTANGEIARLAPWNLTPRIVFHLCLNSVSCVALNYTIFLNCTVNSPLAHAVTGNVKAAFATAGGVLLMDKSLSFLTWVGIAGNFAGAAWFSYVKIGEKLLKVAKKSDVGDDRSMRV